MGDGIKQSVSDQQYSSTLQVADLYNVTTKLVAKTL